MVIIRSALLLPPCPLGEVTTSRCYAAVLALLLPGRYPKVEAECSSSSSSSLLGRTVADRGRGCHMLDERWLEAGLRDDELSGGTFILSNGKRVSVNKQWNSPFAFSFSSFKVVVAPLRLEHVRPCEQRYRGDGNLVKTWKRRRSDSKYVRITIKSSDT